MGPGLDQLRLFAAVVEAGGFRPAAQRLGMSASTLSDVVQRLEEQLGLRLLNRSTRSVAPTEIGAKLLGRVRPALDMVATALDGLQEGASTPAGLLRLSAPGIVARYVLPSILPEFMRRNPDVRVEVSVGEDVVDLVDGGFDAGVRYLDRVASDMVATPIGPRRQRQVLAASPAYLARHGRPHHPRDLAQHRLIGHRFASGTLVVWEFRRGGELVRVAPDAILTTSSIELRLAAATAGVGLIYTFEEVTRLPIAAGALVPLMEDWWDGFAGPFLCHHGARRVPPPLKALIDHITTAI